MRLSDVEPLRRAVEEAHAWVAELRRDLGLDAPHRAYAVLRAVLHAVRDALPYEKAMRFLTALPAAVRGAALEGWTPHTGSAPGEPTRDRFLARIAEELLEVPELVTERAARAVLETLIRRVPDAAALLPETLRESTALEPRAEERRAALEEAERDIRAVLEEARRRGVPEEELPALAAGRRPGRRESPSPAAAEHVDVLDRTLQKTLLWVKEASRELRWENPLHAFRALAATLQALRERLLREETFHLAAQLPILLRGFAFEGWAPGEPYTRERRKEDFLRRVADRLRDVPGADPEAVARAVFRVLSAHVAPGELEDVRAHLPEPLRELWPNLPAPSAPGGSPRSRPAAPPGARARGRQARKEIRSALARAKARGVPERDLPLLTSRRSLRRKKRRTGPRSRGDVPGAQ
jgi:uncharacterized protein (DUF2267 family)